MNTIKDRFPLPKGAKSITPFTGKRGAWREQEFDAEIVVHGVKWFRVRNGLGGRGDREDWIADLPEISALVSNYNWRKNIAFGTFYGSFSKATLGELLLAREAALREICDASARLKQLNFTLKKLNSL